MRHVTILAVMIASIAAAGCSSSDKATCDDACTAVFNCASQLQVTPPFTSVAECVNGCNAAVCSDKQGSIDCIVAVPCTNVTAVEAAITQCETTYCP